MIAVGDFNGDGIPDLAAINEASGYLAIFLSNGDGTFTVVAASPALPGGVAYGLTVADFNADGILDIAANTGGVDPSVFLGNGDGTFTAATPYSLLAPGQYPKSTICYGDFKWRWNRGSRDWGSVQLSANGGDGQASATEVLFGKGDGTFRYGQTIPDSVVASSYLILVCGDLTGNGLSELIVSEEGAGSVTVAIPAQTAQATLNGVMLDPGSYLVESRATVETTSFQFQPFQPPRF